MEVAEVLERDHKEKSKQRQYADKRRRAVPRQIQFGDNVVLK